MALSNMFLVPLLIEWLASKKSAVSDHVREADGEVRFAELSLPLPAKSQSSESNSYQATVRLSGHQPIFHFRSCISAPT